MVCPSGIQIYSNLRRKFILYLRAYNITCNKVVLTLYRDPGGTLYCVAKDTHDAMTSRSDPFLKIALWKCAKS